jgi:hypothetical protein
LNTLNPSWWDRLIAKRFGYFLAISLLAWPLLTAIPALKAILSNVMLLDSYPQLFFFTFTNVVAFFFATAILRVLYFRYPTNSLLHRAIGNGDARWGCNRVWFVTLLALITPLVLSTSFGTEFETLQIPFLESCPVCVSTVLCISLSAVFAVIFLWGLGRLKSFLVGSQEKAENFFPFEAFESQGIPVLSRLFDRITNHLSPFGFTTTDLQLGIYLLLLAMMHRFLLPAIEGDRYLLSSAPSAIVLLLWLIGMAFSGMANLLDRWRIPVVVSAILLLTLVFSLVGSTRPFRSFDKISTGLDPNLLIGSQGEDLQWKAIQKRMEQVGRKGPSGKGKTLVIVTCPGGGIHAAAWSACVLDKLCDEYEGFEDSLCIISGVSGGSVGALMFVGSRYENQLLGRRLVKSVVPSNQDIVSMLRAESPALELATRSSLEAISFGATVDDLYGMLGMPTTDRGERLERHFSGRLSEELRKKTLSEWGATAIDGTVPIVVFNATDAVSGRRVLFDSIPTPTPVWEPTRSQKARPVNYRDLLASNQKEKDVLPATAARISATFPYVSPFTKPDISTPLGSRVALCDGGYVDNEGIVTAVTWIDHLVRYWFTESANSERTFDRILLLRIEPALSLDKDQSQESTDPLSYVRWLIGPLEAMMNVRSTSQLERGHLESDLVEVYLDLSTQRSEGKDSQRRQGESSKRWLEHEQSHEAKALGSSPPQSMQDIRVQWKKDLDEMEKNFKGKANSGQRIKQGAAAGKGVVVDSKDDAPVVVTSIKFRDADQAIPLSWKLSKRQKLWYLLSWEKLEELNHDLRPTLDKYFSRRHTEPASDASH